MAEKATIRTFSGSKVTGDVVRENRRQVSAADSLMVAVTGGLWGATLGGGRTTVVTKDGDYVTGRRIR